MMANDFKQEVEQVARLARLKLSDAEKEQMAGKLDVILETAAKIQDLDTTNVEPTAHVLYRPALLREDQIRASLDLTRVLQNAPTRKNSYFLVPRITADGKLEE